MKHAIIYWPIYGGIHTAVSPELLGLSLPCLHNITMYELLLAREPIHLASFIISPPECRMNIPLYQGHGVEMA